MKQDLKNKIENMISNNSNAAEKEIVFQLKQLLYETVLQIHQSPRGIYQLCWASKRQK